MDKKQQRQIATQARKALSNEQRKQFSKMICDNLWSVADIKDAKVILSYAAMSDEANPCYFDQKARELSIEIAYPVSYRDGIMKAYIPESEGSFEIGKYGIKSPKENESRLVDPSEIDVVLVPCVAFDSSLKRLGHGAGYYDRYLPLCTKAKFICVAFEAQKLDNIITDEFDKPMEVIVSEKKIYLSE